MTCTADHRAAQAAERAAWKALETLRDVAAGRIRAEDGSKLLPLAEDLRQWAERLMPAAEANWRAAHLAANPKGEPGERTFAGVRRYRR
jgi:hypothetical protein